MTIRSWAVLVLLGALARAQVPAQPEYGTPPVASSPRYGRVLDAHPHGGGLIEMASGGHAFATANPSGDGTILIWDQTHRASIGSGSPIRPGSRLAEEVRFVIRGHTEPVTCMAFKGFGVGGQTGVLFASGSEDGTVRILRTGFEDDAVVLGEATDWVTGVGWVHPRRDGRPSVVSRPLAGLIDGPLVTASLDGKVRWYSVSHKSGKITATLDHTVDLKLPLTSLAVDRVTAVVAVGDEAGGIYLFEKPGGAPAGVLKGHFESVGTLAFGDGRLFSGSNDKTIRVWDPEARACSAILRGHAGWVSDIFVDGDRLASASWDKSVRLWDLKTMRETDVVAWHSEPVLGVGVCARSGQIVTGTTARAPMIWEARPEVRRRPLERGHRLPVYHAAVSANGQYVLTASVDHTAGVWEASTGHPIVRLGGHGGAVTFVAVTRDGRRAATASADGLVRLWALPSGRLVAKLEGHSEPVNTVAFDPSGRWLASGGRDEKVIVWSVLSNRRHKVYEGHTDDLKAVTWSPDGKTLASVSDDGTLRLWDVAGTAKPRVITAHPAPLHTVAYSPDGSRIVTGSLDQTLRFWTRDLNPIRTVSGFGRGVNTAEWNAAGTRVIASSSDGNASVIDASTGKIVARAPPFRLACTWAGFDPGGQLAVTACIDGTVRQSVIATGEIIRHYPSDAGRTLGVGVAPDGTTYTTHEDGRLRAWDLVEMKQLWTTDGTGPVAAAGGFVASGTADARGLRLRRHPGGDLIRDLRYDGEPAHLAFVLGGKRLLAVDGEGAVSLLDTSGAAPARRVTTPGPVVAIAVAKDLNRVAVACRGGEILVIDLRTLKVPEQWRASARPTAIGWAPDDRWIVVGDEDGDIDAFGRGARLGQTVRLSAHSGPVVGLAFDGAHSLLSSIGSDATVRAWDIDGGVSLNGVLGRRGERPLHVTADPLGRFIVTATDLGLFVTDPRAHPTGSAEAFDDGQWACWRRGLLRGSIPWVLQERDQGMQPLRPRLPAPDGEVVVKARWDTTTQNRLIVRVDAPSGRTLRDLRLLPSIENVSTSASVVPEGVVSELAGPVAVGGTSSAVLSAIILGDAKTLRLVVRHHGGSVAVPLPE